jgi:peptidoglycan/LPS O-acetylase OafA/YrhL
MTRSATAPEARVFHTLDALRGIAAIGVVAFHMRGAFAPLATPGGYLAVDLFFIMSGVVLSNAYEARFRAGMGVLGFMRVRFIRLYPLYFAGTLLGIAVTVASMYGRNISHWDRSALIQAVLLALVFLPNFSARPNNQLFPLNVPCWSLFLEILVNLLFVLLWPLLSSRRLIAVCVLTGSGVLFATLQQGNLDQGSTGAGLIVGLARTIFGFSAGILIARNVGHRPRNESNARVLAMVGVFAVAIVGWPEGQMRAVWDSVCVLVVFPLLVYCGTLFDPGSRLQKIATFLGVTSYAVYVLHSPLSSILGSATRHFAPGDDPDIGAPYLGFAVLAVLLAGCWLVDRYMDMPIRRYLSRVVPKMPNVGRGGVKDIASSQRKS